MEPRPWTEPHAPTLREPDPFLYLRLRVRDVWRADDGDWWSIGDEPNVRLWSILGYLRWHAPGLMERDPGAGEYAGPDAYLASRPLVDAIDAELAARGAIARGESLALVRAVGLAPWELAPRSRRRSAAR